MSDDLFPGFESHWIDTEVGRIFARSKGDGPPLVLLHGFPQTHACGTASPRRSRRRTGSSAWTCAAMAGPPRRRATPSTRLYSKRAMGEDVVSRHGGARPCAFRGCRAMTAARASATASRSTIPAAWSGSRCSTSCRPIHVWAQISAGADPGGALGLPLRACAEARRGDRPRPAALFRGTDAQVVGDRTISSLRSARARSSYRQSCNEPTRIHAFCEDYRAGATRDRRSRRGGSCRRQDDPLPDAMLIWSDFYLSGGPRAANSAARSLAAEASLPKAHGRRHQRPAISWPRKTRARRWRRCRISSG